MSMLNLNAATLLRARFKRAQIPNETMRFGRDVRADWQIACVSFLILALLAVALNLFVYRRIRSGEIFLSGAEKPESPRVLDRFELEQTVLFYKNKHERFDKLRRAPLVTSAPFVQEAKPRE